MPEDHTAQCWQPTRSDQINLVVVDQEGIGGEGDLTINVELLLRSGGVADSNRLRATIPRQMIACMQRRRRSSVDIVEDTEFGPCQTGRMHQPTEIRAGF